ARMYRTGDRGRRLPDGEFEFAGRADRQVKVRGFRVELGELESALAAHADVTGAAVLAVADDTGAKRLAAYVSASPDSHLTAADLRAWVGERLPEYLRPSYYVLLDQLPVDPNGKIDRRALPQPWASRDQLDLPAYVPPRTSMERLLATVLAETLGLDRVGREDDFFQLGGDSLRSVAVLEQLREGGIAVTAREFFAHPRIADLAAFVDRSGVGGRVLATGR
ncbi:non-ribosomal peptide synthetase, partial [Acrocarpospora phusangensis]|uniref:non-ribosomal peptide synthetase n=1 Tax=Acrocarpospora phusangensis TaxID=1070424 RepID=UPI00194DC4DA